MSVAVGGKHLQGSPFSLEVVDRPLYRKVGESIQEEQAMGNLISFIRLRAIRGGYYCS